MDIGFTAAGVSVIWANEWDKNASATYEANNPGIMRQGDIRKLMSELPTEPRVDIVFGGPPCQGFSVAGKMDPGDERSTLLWRFLDVVERVQPRCFVCENVKALAVLEKWSSVREDFMAQAERLGYSCSFIVLNATDFGIPQKRERVFFIGSRVSEVQQSDILNRLDKYRCKPPSLRELLSHLGPAGTEMNPKTCNAKITLASNPILRKSPYAGMLFNGLGRPLPLDGYSATLPASMGGNKTPIIDEGMLHGAASDDWVRTYHSHLMGGAGRDGGESTIVEAPPRLRRITIKEASLIQTFPEKYRFCGGNSSVYKQIGNAVPCKLAEVVARVTLEIIDGVENCNKHARQKAFTQRQLPLT